MSADDQLDLNDLLPAECLDLKYSMPPECCRNCQHYTFDPEKMTYQSYCMLGLWLPTKKGTCQKHKPYRAG